MVDEKNRRLITNTYKVYPNAFSSHHKFIKSLNQKITQSISKHPQACAACVSPVLALIPTNMPHQSFRLLTVLARSFGQVETLPKTIRHVASRLFGAIGLGIVAPLHNVSYRLASGIWPERP
jgi:hypothetical protein